MEPIKQDDKQHPATMEPIKKDDKRHLDTMPTGSLGIIPVKGCEEMASEIDFYLTRWRAERESEHKDSLAYIGYKRPSYIIECNLPRFGTGEGKGVLAQSVRGMDLYLLASTSAPQGNPSTARSRCRSWSAWAWTTSSPLTRMIPVS